MSERLQKRLADAGVASRRQIETWITDGRITVNGRPAELGQKVDEDDHVRVDGRRILLARKRAAPRVLLYRKRVGEIVTREDPEGRQTVFRKLPPLTDGRWIAVGRLDINTSGLLLFTDHGELARRLMHPSFEISREYAVRVLGELTPEMIDTLTRTGVMMDGHLARFDTLRSGSSEDGEGSANQWWTVTLHEGRHREVRRLFESQNLQVSRLIRLAYGPLVLGRGIRTGGFREATVEECAALLQAVSLDPALASVKPVRAGRKPVVADTAASPKVARKPRARADNEEAPAGRGKPKGGNKAPPWHASRKRKPST